MSSSDVSALDRLREHGAATVHEALGRIGAMDPALKPLDPSMRVAGRALTVDCPPGDNLAVQYATSIAQPGDVLVVDAKAFCDAGPWGDILTQYAQRRGVAGLVIDGAVRDSRDIVDLGFPTFSRAVCIKGTDKFNPGRVNVPVTCGGVLVTPGDVVVGDADGLTVVPADRVSEAVRLADAREQKEAEFRAALDRGESLLDLMGLRSKLHALGIDAPAHASD